jgi:hypothetical protein
MRPQVSPAILLVMTPLTGLADAVSFLAMGHVFTCEYEGQHCVAWQRPTARTLIMIRSISLPPAV